MHARNVPNTIKQSGYRTHLDILNQGNFGQWKEKGSRLEVLRVPSLSEALSEDKMGVNICGTKLKIVIYDDKGYSCEVEVTQ